MYLSYFTDEAHDDFAEALRLGTSWGLHCAEVRTVDGINILDMTDEQVERAKRLLDQYDMKVSALATPYLKCRMPGSSGANTGPMHGAKELSYDDHLRLLKRGVQLAEYLGTSRIRVFSFWRVSDDSFWPILEEAVTATINACAGSGVTPCLENEGACCIGTASELAQAAHKLTDERLKFIWDPGNSSYSGQFASSEDRAVFGPRIGLVHIKECRIDADTNEKVPCPPGKGITDYGKELSYIASVYNGPITLEPHYRPNGDMTEGMRQCIESLKELCEKQGITLE
jgi:L-ribulose-5-phosphate 3-epimerase